MSRSKKMLTWVLLVACFVVQTSLFVSAKHKGNFNVTLPNLQRSVELFTGESYGHGQYSDIWVKGGTVNIVYAQLRLSGTGAPVSEWVPAYNDGNRYPVYFTTTLGEGTGLTMMGKQKNVTSKTASGYVYL